MNQKDFDDLKDKLTEYFDVKFDNFTSKFYKMAGIFLTLVTLFVAGILIFTFSNSIRIGEDKGNITAVQEKLKTQDEINKKQDDFNNRILARQAKLDSSVVKKEEYYATNKLILLNIDYLILKQSGASQEELAPIKNDIRKQRQIVFLSGVDINPRGYEIKDKKLSMQN